MQPQPNQRPDESESAFKPGSEMIQMMILKVQTLGYTLTSLRDTVHPLYEDMSKCPSIQQGELISTNLIFFPSFIALY